MAGNQFKGNLTASASSLNHFKLIELHEAIRDYLLTTAYIQRNTLCHLYSCLTTFLLVSKWLLRIKCIKRLKMSGFSFTSLNVIMH